MKKFELFTAEDFDQGWYPEKIADRANAILNERGKRVFACEWAKHEIQWNGKRYSNDTHEALLIGERIIE